MEGAGGSDLQTLGQKSWIPAASGPSVTHIRRSVCLCAWLLHCVWARARCLVEGGKEKKTSLLCSAIWAQLASRHLVTDGKERDKERRERRRERMGLNTGTKVVSGEMYRFTLWRRSSVVVTSTCASLFLEFERIWLKRDSFCLNLIPLCFMVKGKKNSSFRNPSDTQELLFFSLPGPSEDPSYYPGQIPVGDLKHTVCSARCNSLVILCDDKTERLNYFFPCFFFISRFKLRWFGGFVF